MADGSPGVLDFYNTLCKHARIQLGRVDSDLASVVKAANRWPDGSEKQKGCIELIKLRKAERDEVKERLRAEPKCEACRAAD